MQSKATPLELISTIWDQTKEKDYQPDLIDSLDHLLEPLATYLQVNKTQAFVLAHLFVINCNNDKDGLMDMAKHLNCNPVKLLVFKKDTTFLAENGYLKKRQGSIFLSEQLYVDETLTKAITENESLPTLKKEEHHDVIAFLEKIGALYDKRAGKEIGTEALLLGTMLLVDKFSSLQFVQAIQKENIRNDELFFFFAMCWETIQGRKHIELSSKATVLFDNPHARITFMQNFLNQKSELIKKGWVEIEETIFFGDTILKLTETGVALLELEDLRILNKKSNRKELIQPGQIQAKRLFYNPENAVRIKQIEQVLHDEYLLPFQERLRLKNLPTGITILLHGSAGTGKTETVFQWAQTTQRELFKVDISKTKSTWFGESEKLIKKVFDDYRTLLKSSDKAPILLFNEADAIISKRKEVGSSNVDQTENAIQNIILEELERFEGLFMATTNLINNFDQAFDRRFLFKVELGKPQVQTRMEIWKSKPSFLCDADAEILSRQFEFSGGQIDNISRKAALVEVLEDRKPSFREFIRFCEEETLHKKGNQAIGFKADTLRHILS